MADTEPERDSSHLRRRHSTSTSRPGNSLNDATIPSHAASSEPDTCRICRGEPTPAEPLFYPCKCSGSIKYVHQDCLMEWLSHSQKKHCELCKTPFRFTKLYSSKMPKALPKHIFVGHMAKYFLDNVMFWLRAVLVACVWLCWLPYLMRRVWCLLFWLSDEGLGSLLGKPAGLEVVNTALNSSGIGANGTTAAPLTTLLSAATNLSGQSGTLEAPNNATEPGMEMLFYIILRALVPSIVRGSPSSGAGYNTNANATSATSSLLSNVNVLRNLTRVPAFNQAVIMILEGQFLTVSVIACFILIILVRDYVVQQQPEINMRAAFAAQENAPPEERGPAPVPVHEDHGADAAEADGGDQERDARTLIEEDGVAPNRADQEQRPIAAFTRRLPQRGSDQDLPSSSQSGVEPGSEDRGQSSSGANQGRGDLQAARDPLPTVQEYLRIYRQAEGDPETILRIMEEENLQDRLGSWIRVTRARLEEERASSPFRGDVPEFQESAEGGSDMPPNEPLLMDGFLEHEDASLNGMERDSGEEGLADRRRDHPVAEEAEPTPASTPIGGSKESAGHRRRAVSDGPQPREFPHPLANNNWHIAHDTAASESSTASANPHQLSISQARPEDGDSVLSTAAEHGSSSNRSDTTTVFSERDGHAGDELDHELEFEPLRATNREAAPAAPALAPAPAPAPGPTADDVRDELGEEVQQIIEPAPRRRFLDQVADFLLGGVEEAAVNGHAIPGDDARAGALEGANGFVQAGDVGADVADNNFERDPEAVEAAVAAGLDPDALDDIEDFEGILELIGIRGPLIGLFQNAIFCAGLVFVAIFVCIFLPYNIGRTSIWLVANPMRLVRMLFALSTFIQDVVAVIAGSLSWATLSVVHLSGRVLGLLQVTSATNTSLAYTWELTANASTRLASGFLAEVPIQPSEMQNFSAVSHDALVSLKGHISAVFSAAWAASTFLLSSSLPDLASGLVSGAANAMAATAEIASTVWTSVANPGTWIINLDKPAPIVAVDAGLAHWDGFDRFWAIVGGYATLAVAATVYVSRTSPFFAGELGQEWEASMVDLINQASGVTKVILIIGIEMLVFPLYCGLLLDAALLPLFEEATIRSRFEFSMNYPTTSMFVHWFVGTGYMFHFALFVSMCRKIMRRGVLYFIRDPDDPDFHPIRDVLEKPFLTQLRKILFSGLVYGGLVIVCLGGVVWGLAVGASSVLPIHYSSNEPVLEFPVDLLFYNFLMPLAVKVLRPSDALHAMYTWWFRRCARMLRLTWFLFGQRQIDEEGTLVLAANSPHRNLPWFRRFFLGLDADGNVAPKTLRAMFNEAAYTDSSPVEANELHDADAPGADEAPPAPAPAPAGGLNALHGPIMEDMALSPDMERVKTKLVESGQLIKCGRFVRTPASDQVRIPRGRKVFFEMDENAAALPTPDPQDPPYHSDQYQTVYIPPRFGTRVFLFILFIWIFAAVTGVGLTIIPLQVGRWMFKSLLPSHVRTNDIYAFSIGIYVLGTILYAALHMTHIMHKARGWVSEAGNTLLGDNAAARTGRVFLEVAKFVYAYANVLIVFPLLASALVELYVIIPLHTWMYPPILAAPSQEAGTDTGPVGPVESAMASHTIRAVQAWTLGLLYLKLGTRVLTNTFAGTRLALACRLVFHRGWFRPDVAILTRAFVVPGLAISAVAIVVPPLLARFILAKDLLPAHVETKDPVVTAFVYRISFMLAAAFVLSTAAFWSLVGVFHVWQTRIKDEVYLIGERLHNYGVATAGTVKVREG